MTSTVTLWVVAAAWAAGAASPLLAGPGHERQQPHVLAADSPSIAISPPIVERSIRPGSTETFTIEVTNTGVVSVTCRPELAELELDEQGIPRILPQGKGGCSLTDWAKADLGEVVLEPGAAHAFDIVVTVPRLGRGGRYGALAVTAKPRERLAARDAQPLVLEVCSLFLIKAAGTENVRGRVGAIQLRDDGRIVATLENTGNCHFRATGDIALKSGGRIVARLGLKGGTGTVLPGGAREFSAGLPHRVDPGTYEVAASFRLDGKLAVRETSSLTIQEDDRDSEVFEGHD